MAHFNGKDMPVFSSWLLPFDPLLNGSKVLHGDFLWVVAGSAFFILVGSWVFWSLFLRMDLPIGNCVGLGQAAGFLAEKTDVKPSKRNSRVRFRLLAFVLTASFLSLQFAGLV